MTELTFGFCVIRYARRLDMLDAVSKYSNATRRLLVIDVGSMVWPAASEGSVGSIRPSSKQESALASSALRPEAQGGSVDETPRSRAHLVA